jgi:tetratricopeptide (TPR) repeat protein
MGSQQWSVKWIVYCASLTLMIAFYLGTQLVDGWDGILLGVAMVLLIVTVPVVAYLARQDVREALGLIFTLYRAHRAIFRGDFAQAEGYFGKAVSQAEACHTKRDTYLGTILCELGDLYRQQGRLADAEPVLQRALRHFEEVEWSEPADGVKARRNRALAWCQLAALYINQGRFDEAEFLCRDVLAVVDDDPAARPEHMAVALHNLALALAGRGNYAEAERLSREAIARIPRQVERGTISACIVLSCLADLCCRRGRPDEAEPLARRAVASFEKTVFGRNHPHLARFLNILAEVVREQGNLEEAESVCLRSQALLETSFGPEHPRLDSCLVTLARIRIAQSRLAEAEPLLRRCLAILDKTVVAEHPERWMRRQELAALLRQLGRTEEAVKWETRAQSTGIYTARPEHLCGVRSFSGLKEAEH